MGVEGKWETKVVIPPRDEGVGAMAKVAMIGGVEVKVGDKVAVTQWLTFTYTIVDIPRANKIVLMDNYSKVNLTKNHKGGWNFGGGRARLTPNPNPKVVETWNNDVRNSETWMCM